jgi:flagellar basal body-associated protein FliL
MLRIKKALRIALLVFLVLLALAGVGIPPPRQLSEKKEDTIELVENQDGESEKK